MKISPISLAFFLLSAKQSIAGSGKKKSKTDSPTMAPTSGGCWSRKLQNEPNIQVVEPDFDFESFVYEHRADPDGSFGFYKSLLSPEDCDKVMEYAEAFGTKEVHEAHLDTEFTTTALEEKELAQVLGKEKFEEIIQEFHAYSGKEGPLTKIYVRDMEWHDEGANVIAYHTDELDFFGDRDGYTMVIKLGGDFEGGQITYVNQEGYSEPFVPVGGASIHKSDVLHGVSGLKGRRITLILESYSMDHHDAAKKTRMLCV